MTATATISLRDGKNSRIVNDVPWQHCNQ